MAEKGFGEDKIASLIGRFYSDLSLDGRFVVLDDNVWDLRERYPFEYVQTTSEEDDEDEDEPTPVPEEPENYEKVEEILTEDTKITITTKKTTVRKEVEEVGVERHTKGNLPTIYEDNKVTETYQELDITYEADTHALLDIDNYTAIPDKYLRPLLQGVAYKYYIRDEEGERVASEYYVDYQQALFMILRDYDEFVPPIFRNHRGGYIIGAGSNVIGPEHYPEYRRGIFPGMYVEEDEPFRIREPKSRNINRLKLF